MQHHFIYPENKAKKPLEESDKAIIEDLKTNLNYAGLTLISCDWRPKGKYSTIWNIKVSTPGHCDIFKLIEAIRLSFDLNGLDETFSYINTAGQEVYIEFTFSA